MNPHPLATIQFQSVDGAFEPFIRHWYHVPRLGDRIAIALDLEGNLAIGVVSDVIWTDGQVTLRVKQETP